MTDRPLLRIDCSRGFPQWLRSEGISLALSTYETGKLFLIGRAGPDRLSILERSFDRAMGLWASPQADELWLACTFQLWRFRDALDGGRYGDCDRLYLPAVAWTTGELDIHDLARDRSGRLLFVATRMSCIATLDEGASFVPLWKPPFISRITPEDRCHLNGLALREGLPAYATAISECDVADGWRDHRREGGVVIDLARDEVVLRGLSMPHSPRWHRGRLWLLESGTGWLGWMEPENRSFRRLAFCPGYARGLAFSGDWAVVGVSLPRHEPSFLGLPLEEELARRRAVPRCGVLVFDIRSGDLHHWLRFEGIVRELYDVAVLRGVRRPMAIGLRGEEIRRTLTVGRPAPLFP